MKEKLIEAMHDSPRNKARRMRVMRRQVAEHDIDHWASAFLDDLGKTGPRADAGRPGRCSRADPGGPPRGPGRSPETPTAGTRRVSAVVEEELPRLDSNQ